MDHIEEAVACALSPTADPALKQQVRVSLRGRLGYLRAFFFSFSFLFLPRLRQTGVQLFQETLQWEP